MALIIHSVTFHKETLMLFNIPDDFFIKKRQKKNNIILKLSTTLLFLFRNVNFSLTIDWNASKAVSYVAVNVVINYQLFVALTNRNVSIKYE